MIDPEEATEIIEEFQAEFGPAHLHLAYHAAFPLILNPDLLYHIWANFQWDLQGNHLDIPWYGVADVLLSPLCREVAYETYAMEELVRDQLLAALAAEPRFQQGERSRLRELGVFLERYAWGDLQNKRRSIREQAQAQRWNALAFVQPQRLNEEMRQEYSIVGTKTAEHLRLANLLQTFNLSLSTWAKPDAATAAEFQTLVTYSRGWANHLRQRTEEAVTNFATYLDTTAQPSLLPIPAELLDRVRPPRQSPPTVSAQPASGLRSQRIERLRKSTQNDEPILTTLVRRIRSRMCVPIIDLPFLTYQHDEIRQSYAQFIDYPLADDTSFESMLTYAQMRSKVVRDDLALKAEFLSFLKKLAYHAAEETRMDPAQLAEAEEQIDALTCTELIMRLAVNSVGEHLLQLANFPLPIYITTSYHGFIEEALRRAGKRPTTDFCRWNRATESIPSIWADGRYSPTAHEPLVYHLYGTDQYPDSIVLTEADYISFLKETARNREAIPAPVWRAIATSSLLLLEHQAQRLPFRVLQNWLNRRQLSQVQVTNVLQFSSVFTNEFEQQVYAKYWQSKGYQLYWGTGAALIGAIYQAWQ